MTLRETLNIRAECYLEEGMPDVAVHDVHRLTCVTWVNISACTAQQQPPQLMACHLRRAIKSSQGCALGSNSNSKLACLCMSGCKRRQR